MSKNAHHFDDLSDDEFDTLLRAAAERPSSNPTVKSEEAAAPVTTPQSWLDFVEGRCASRYLSDLDVSLMLLNAIADFESTNFPFRFAKLCEDLNENQEANGTPIDELLAQMEDEKYIEKVVVSKGIDSAEYGFIVTGLGRALISS